MRQEGKGLLIGAYEKDGRFWAEDGTPLDFGHELFPDDLERIEENFMRACERVPALGNAGLKRGINGPMIWSPDSAALFGPVPELKNYYCCNGIIPGFSQSGGLGLMSAEDYHLATDLEAVRGETLPRGRALGAVGRHARRREGALERPESHALALEGQRIVLEDGSPAGAGGR